MNSFFLSPHRPNENQNTAKLQPFRCVFYLMNRLYDLMINIIFKKKNDLNLSLAAWNY